jgi:excisionase family DNA binding protein
VTTTTSSSRPKERQYLSVEDAASYVDVSTQTIRRSIDSGELPAYRFGKKLIRVQQDDLDAMLRRIPTVGQ